MTTFSFSYDKASQYTFKLDGQVQEIDFADEVDEIISFNGGAQIISLQNVVCIKPYVFQFEVLDKNYDTIGSVILSLI